MEKVFLKTMMVDTILDPLSKVSQMDLFKPLMKNLLMKANGKKDRWMGLEKVFGRKAKETIK